MKTKTERTYANLKRILDQSLVNPQQADGILKVILEMNDPAYYEKRAIELIKENTAGFIHMEKIRLAITLLGLARLHMEYT